MSCDARCIVLCRVAKKTTNITSALFCYVVLCCAIYVLVDSTRMSERFFFVSIKIPSRLPPRGSMYVSGMFIFLL